MLPGVCLTLVSATCVSSQMYSHHLPWDFNSGVQLFGAAMEKDIFCKSLSDFGLEGVIQTKQYCNLEALALLE